MSLAADWFPFSALPHVTNHIVPLFVEAHSIHGEDREGPGHGASGHRVTADSGHNHNCQLGVLLVIGIYSAAPQPTSPQDEAPDLCSVIAPGAK